MLVDFFVLPVVESPVDIVDQVFGCDGFDIFYDFGVTADLYVPKVLYKAECWRTKSNTFHNKTNCLSTIYEQNEIYNLS